MNETEIERTVEEAAAHAGCSTRTVRRAIHAGRLPARLRTANGRRRLLINANDLAQWAAGQPADSAVVTHPAIIELAITLDTEHNCTSAALTGYAADGCPRTVVEVAPADTVTAITASASRVARRTWGIELGAPLGHADLPLTGGGRRHTSIWALTPA